MELVAVDCVNSISRKDFQEKYFKNKIPVVIKDLARSWPAYKKWDWEYLRQVAGDKKVGIYNNVKSDAHTPVNRADDYTTFGNYIHNISNCPSQWRIFLFNVFKHAPQLIHDFVWPEHLLRGFVKYAPMLFVGGRGSITHIHFDIDLSHILHTQFIGRKRVLLFPYAEQYKLYRKPFEVLSLVDFSNYYDPEKSKVDLENFPALKNIKGYDFILEHGDTLFMPAGYWHHMEYLDSGFAMSLRSIQSSWPARFKGLWNLIGMRFIDTMMKKSVPVAWYNWKLKRVYRAAEKSNNTQVMN